MPAAEQATLPMPALGQLAVSVTTDEEAGVTRYVLKGPRLRGVMIVLPKAVGDELVPTGVTVSFGDTLWSIAETVAPEADPRDVIDAIVRLNALEGVSLEAGQSLAIPAEYDSSR